MGGGGKELYFFLQSEKNNFFLLFAVNFCNQKRQKTIVPTNKFYNRHPERTPPSMILLERLLLQLPSWEVRICSCLEIKEIICLDSVKIRINNKIISCTN